MRDRHSSADRLVVEYDFPEPPQKVWRALTEPALLAAWLMPSDMRAEVGKRFRFVKGEGVTQGEDSTIECEVLAAEPNKLLRYRWRDRQKRNRNGEQRSLDSVVTFELSHTPAGGTHLRLVHSDFAMTSFRPIAQSVGPDTRATRVIQLGSRRSSVHHRRAGASPLGGSRSRKLRKRTPPTALARPRPRLRRAA